MKTRKYGLLLAGACISLIAWASPAQTRILPLGDSLTSGEAPYSSFRYWLWNDLVRFGYNVDFVGTQYGVADGTPSHTNFDQDHEGHPGWTTQDGLDNIDSIMAATQPDIVLLNLGSNDIEDGIPVRTAIENLKALIERMRAANPNIVVLLAEPPPFHGPHSARMFPLAFAIYRLALVENQRQSRVLPVNMVAGFSVRLDTYDGDHPNERGEKLIARRLFGMLRLVLRRH
jgi:acyl-CoA thioesterase I